MGIRSRPTGREPHAHILHRNMGQDIISEAHDRKQKKTEAKKKGRQDGGMGVWWDKEQRNSQPQEHRVGHQFAWQKTDAWGEKLGIKEND